MFILLICLLQVGLVDDSGLGELGLSVVKRFPPSLYSEPYARGGTLSEDGKLLFVGLGAKTPIYDLEIGENWYTEHIVYRKHRTGTWQFGTQSQWGHIPKEDWVGFDHTRVFLAVNKNSWLSKVYVTDRQFIVAFIDQRERGVSPNRHVIVDALKHRPRFSRLAIWNDGDSGSYFLGVLTKDQKEYTIRAYRLTPEDGTVTLLKAPVATSPMLPIVKGEEIGPTRFDPVGKRVFYSGMTVRGDDPSKNFYEPPREWDFKAKVWRNVALPKQSSYLYWNGNLLTQVRNTRELFLFSDDRKSLKLIGKYTWLANSVSGEFCFVEEVETGDYLLLKLNSVPTARS